MSSRTLVLEREEEVVRHIQSLKPLAAAASVLSARSTAGADLQKVVTAPPAWTVDRWARAHAAALRDLYALRAEVDEGSAVAAACLPTAQADDAVAFWRRRTAEVTRLGQELVQASQARLSSFMFISCCPSKP
jgi:hypothetical protein